jgi:4-hydroxybutyryl-CoA dehydratase/vinylacetyl-CoA-Delta-isomerase
MSHTCKYTCTKAPFDAVRYARDILAGFGETAPSEIDMRSPEVGELCQKAFNPGNPDYDSFDRLRAARFIEHMVRGSNWTAMALHGGGNQEAATVMARMFTDWDYVKGLVKVASGIEKDEAVKEEFINSVGQRKGRICNYGNLPKIDE